ncbi:transmembrane amino acid transporter protein-domain-containing protein [Sporodiniella umbellata]|nr:transmembrane amino acid transporter protein-domain-containing protein [Sporodiniella umbellata]
MPRASVGKAMFMFLKAFIGSGVLFLPKAEYPTLCWGSYGDMGGILYGRWVRWTVLFFIVVSQIGFVCSYFIFVSGNLVNAVDVLSNCTSPILEKYYIWFPLIVLVPFSLVRHIARLSFAIILADALILFGLFCVIYFTADQLKNAGIGPNVAAVNPENFALMIGTATFSFEGIGLLIPIVESMRRPEKFPFVLTVGMMIVTGIYILIGTLSYLAYGDKIQASLTIAVELLYSLAICLTSPFMLFPALKIIENGIFGRFKSGRESAVTKWSKNVYRVVISVACAAIAFGVGGDNLDKFVSLVGSVACVPLCFVFPGMFHWKISSKVWDKLIDAFLMLFGMGIMVYTLYVTVYNFAHPKEAGGATAPYCPA